MGESTGTFEFSVGGLHGRTEIVTTDGPIAVAGLAVGDEVYALNASTRVLKPKGVTDIERFEYAGSLVDVSARRVDWLLHPEQRIPYQTACIDRVRFQRAGDIFENSIYHLINEWWKPEPPRRETVGVTEFLSEFEVCVSVDCHGHTFRAALPDGCEPLDRNGWTGYHFDASTFKEFQEELESLASGVTIRDKKRHWRRPYRFDGDDFIRFIGWYVTEGSCDTNPNRDTARVSIAQKTPENRERIDSLLERMGLEPHTSENGFAFSWNVFARLLKRLCGEGCRIKCLPGLVWGLPRDQQELLLQVLLDGDGTDWGIYYTSSRRLADDVLKLCIETSRKPRYSFKDQTGVWEVYVGHVNDRLTPTRQASKIADAGTFYRLTVEDYDLVMAGRSGRFQWLGVSRVS